MKIFRLAGLIAPLLILALVQVACAADIAPTAESGHVYLPSDNPLADVDAVLVRAKVENKLALIVMGANWCHDSRALASRLQKPKLQPIIEKNYELEFIDVGYLDTGMEVITRFGQPVIYGTPTVLIIDPQSEQVINFDSSPRWRNAHSISMKDTVAYFSQMAAIRSNHDNEPVSPQLEVLQSEIVAFERAQSERLYEAFAVVGPMLKLYEQDNAPDEFDDYWKSLAKMRAQITDDLAELRTEARRRSGTGETNIVLSYPEYPAFAWEQAQ